MLYKILYGNEVRNNIKNIKNVLSEYYPSTFSKFIKDFNSKIEILKIFPYSYQKIYNSENRKIQLKYKYKLIYKIKDNRVIILKIQIPR